MKRPYVTCHFDSGEELLVPEDLIDQIPDLRERVQMSLTHEIHITDVACEVFCDLVHFLQGDSSNHSKKSLQNMIFVAGKYGLKQPEEKLTALFKNRFVKEKEEGR